MMYLRTANLEPVKYATEKSAGFDFTSSIEVNLIHGTTVLIPTGVFIESAAFDDFIMVTSRSGLALQGIIVKNAPGVIDADYKQEIKIMLWNTSEKSFKINVGDRIAQGVVMKFKQATGDVEIKTVDRTGGFGSTGVK
jgi:dUTP pyrophosphatase